MDFPERVDTILDQIKLKLRIGNINETDVKTNGAHMDFSERVHTILNGNELKLQTQPIYNLNRLAFIDLTYT